MSTTKEKIFKSALKLFTEQGIKKTSTAQLSKDAGIASGTLFVHFKTKQILVEELYLQVKKSASGSLDEIIQEDITVEKNVKNITKTMIEYFIKNYDEFVFLELVETDPLISKEIRTLGYERFQKTMQYLKNRTEEGYFKVQDFELVFRINSSLIKTFIQFLRDKKIKRVPAEYLDLIWEAIRK